MVPIHSKAPQESGTSAAGTLYLVLCIIIFQGGEGSGFFQTQEEEAINPCAQMGLAEAWLLPIDHAARTPSPKQRSDSDLNNPQYPLKSIRGI